MDYYIPAQICMGELGQLVMFLLEVRGRQSGLQREDVHFHMQCKDRQMKPVLTCFIESCSTWSAGDQVLYVPGRYHWVWHWCGLTHSC